jgi:hypothetical protein
MINDGKYGDKPDTFGSQEQDRGSSDRQVLHLHAGAGANLPTDNENVDIDYGGEGCRCSPRTEAMKERDHRQC